MPFPRRGDLGHPMPQVARSGPHTRGVSGPVLLVDAANVVGSRPDGWWRDRAGAAQRLVTALAALPRSELAPEAVVVVLEGAARAGVAPGTYHRVEVHHADGSGDDLLVALCHDEVLLVTADRDLAARARERGAEVVGPRRLLEQLSG